MSLTGLVVVVRGLYATGVTFSLPPLETALLIAGLLLVISAVASKASGRLGVPALLVFLAVGMFAGSDGPIGIYFDDPGLAQTIGVIALLFILFSGGLDTPWPEVRPIVGHAISLATVGVVITCVALAWFAVEVLRFSWIEGLLLGAIVSSTDAAAVFAVLRARGLHLPARLRATVELESGSNDPMAVFITAALVAVIAAGQIPAPQDVALDFVLQMFVGAAVGYLLGRFCAWLVNRLQLEYAGLYFVVTLSLPLLAYAIASFTKGNGFLAVYVAGLTLGNRRFVHRRTLLRFHDGVAWLMQITMFLALGLLVFPSQLPAVALEGLGAGLFLTFVARPLAVFLTMLPVRMPWRQKVLLAWMGLRGAVPVVLATFPLLAGLAIAPRLFHLVFFTVLISVAVQGPTIPWLARRLGVGGVGPSENELPARRDSELVTIAIEESSPASRRSIVQTPLPADCQILLIHREGGFFIPDGSSVILPGDRVMALVSKTSIERLRQVLEG